MAVDVFRRAAELGGHLIVAFVAPVSGSSRGAGLGPGSGASVQMQAADAAAKVAAIRKQVEERLKTTPGASPATAGAKNPLASAGSDAERKSWSARTAKD
jgi:hypothetical protein